MKKFVVVNWNIESVNGSIESFRSYPAEEAEERLKSSVGNSRIQAEVVFSSEDAQLARIFANAMRYIVACEETS